MLISGAKMENVENEASGEDDEGTDKRPDTIENPDKNDCDHLETTTCRDTVGSGVTP